MTQGGLDMKYVAFVGGMVFNSHTEKFERAKEPIKKSAKKFERAFHGRRNKNG